MNQTMYDDLTIKNAILLMQLPIEITHGLQLSGFGKFQLKERCLLYHYFYRVYDQKRCDASLSQVMKCERGVFKILDQTVFKNIALMQMEEICAAHGLEVVPKQQFLSNNFASSRFFYFFSRVCVFLKSQQLITVLDKASPISRIQSQFSPESYEQSQQRLIAEISASKQDFEMASKASSRILQELKQISLERQKLNTQVSKMKVGATSVFPLDSEVVKGLEIVKDHCQNLAAFQPQVQEEAVVQKESQINLTQLKILQNTGTAGIDSLLCLERIGAGLTSTLQYDSRKLLQNIGEVEPQAADFRELYIIQNLAAERKEKLLKLIQEIRKQQPNFGQFQQFYGHLADADAQFSFSAVRNRQGDCAPTLDLLHFSMIDSQYAEEKIKEQQLRLSQLALDLEGELEANQEDFDDLNHLFATKSQRELMQNDPAATLRMDELQMNKSRLLKQKAKNSSLAAKLKAAKAEISQIEEADYDVIRYQGSRIEGQKQIMDRLD